MFLLSRSVFLVSILLPRFDLRINYDEERDEKGEKIYHNVERTIHSLCAQLSLKNKYT